MLLFYQLEPKYIDNYKQLVEAFNIKFQTEFTFFYSVGELTSFQQDPDECLANYMECFMASYWHYTAKDNVVSATQFFKEDLLPDNFLLTVNSYLH